MRQDQRNLKPGVLRKPLGRHYDMYHPNQQLARQRHSQYRRPSQRFGQVRLRSGNAVQQSIVKGKRKRDPILAPVPLRTNRQLHAR